MHFIEDAAESLGSLYKGKPVGCFGIAGILSFNGNKVVTTGGGGAVITNDEKLANKIRHLTTTAKQFHRWEFYHDHVAFNYRMPNINAALGVAQLRKLPTAIEKKRKLAAIYKDKFSASQCWEYITEAQDSHNNYWLNTIKLRWPDEKILTEALEHLFSQGIYARPIWRPMHYLPMYSRFPRSDLSMTEKLAKQIINLPSSPQLIELIHGAT